jgi:hypothetical protein
VTQFTPTSTGLTSTRASRFWSQLSITSKVRSPYLFLIPYRQLPVPMLSYRSCKHQCSGSTSYCAPGSGSTRQRYGSGSGSGPLSSSKKVRKALIPSVMTSFGQFIFEKLCKCTFKSIKQKKISFLLAS